MEDWKYNELLMELFILCDATTSIDNSISVYRSLRRRMNDLASYELEILNTYNRIINKHKKEMEEEILKTFYNRICSINHELNKMEKE